MIEVNLAHGGTAPADYQPQRFPRLRFLAEIAWALVAIAAMAAIYNLDAWIEDARRWIGRKRKK